MFDFSIFISLLLSILVFYLTIFINLKKEIDDLLNTVQENIPKIDTRKKLILLLNITTIILLFILILLYNLPSVINIFNHIDFSGIINFFHNIGSFILKLFPFKKGFFSDTNFKFSFITETFLSLSVEILIWAIYTDIICPIGIEYIPLIIILFGAYIGLLWANNFISLFLSHCIIYCFPFLSIVFNLFIYIILPFIIFIIYMNISLKIAEKSNNH